MKWSRSEPAKRKTMTRPVGKTYYGLLGVSPSASQMELDAAYSSMQAILSEIIDIKAREARQRQLEEAYQLLSNTTRRAIYDASLQAGQAQTVVVGQASAKAARQSPRRNKQPAMIGLAVAGVLLIGGYAGWHWQAARVAEKAKLELARQQAAEAVEQARIEQEQADAIDAEEQARARELEEIAVIREQGEARIQSEMDEQRRAREQEEAAWAKQYTKEYEAAMKAEASRAGTKP